jgi:DNA-directed RNA polymerase subunit omega
MDAPNIVAYPPQGAKARVPVSGKAFDMRSDLVEQALKVIPDIPVLINLVSKRVRQLNTGRAPLVRAGHRAGVADIALLEIIEGKISAQLVDEDAEP